MNTTDSDDIRSTDDALGRFLSTLTPAEPRAFLQQLYGEGPEGSVPITLRGDAPANLWFSSRDTDGMAACLEEGSRSMPTIGFNLHFPQDAEGNQGGPVSTVLGLVRRFPLLDSDRIGSYWPRDWETLAWRMYRMPLKPAFVIHGGDCLQFGWLFSDGVALDSEESRARLERLLRAWDHMLVTLSRDEEGWIFAPELFLDAALIAPGSLISLGRELFQCRVLDFQPRRYSLEAFEHTCQEHRTEGGLTYFGDGESLYSRCDFLSWCREHRQEVPDHWLRIALSALARTADGPRVAQALVEGRDAFPPEEVERICAAVRSEPGCVSCACIRTVLGFPCRSSCPCEVPLENLHREPPALLRQKVIATEGLDLERFPLDTLPEAIRSYAADMAASAGASPDTAGFFALGALALALQGRYAVRLSSWWTEPLSLFLVRTEPLAGPDMLILQRLLRPLHTYLDRTRENLSGQVWDRFCLRRDLDRQQKLCAGRLKRARATEEELEEARQQLEETERQLQANPELSVPRLFLEAGSPEEFLEGLRRENGQACVFLPDGDPAGLRRTAALWSGGKLDWLFQGYTGTPIRGSDSQGSPVVISSPAVSLLAAMDPDTLEDLMHRLAERGSVLTPCFLYSSPGPRPEPVPGPVSPAVQDAYLNRFRHMMRSSRCTVLSLSREAMELWQAWSRELRQRLRGELRDLAPWAERMPGHAARLAAILWRASLDRMPEEPVIGRDAMYSALLLAEHFLVMGSLAHADGRRPVPLTWWKY